MNSLHLFSMSLCLSTHFSALLNIHEGSWFPSVFSQLSWTVRFLHSPLPQPHCSRWISNNRTPLCVLPCSHRETSENTEAEAQLLNYWLLSLPNKPQIYLNPLMRISSAEGAVCITAIISYSIPTVQTCLYFLFFCYMRCGEQYA